jgi:hypothetical protein
MKMLTALLLAVALVSPAFAQKPAFQGTHPRPKPVIVAPASKPVLLHTGKPITSDQKRQLAMTVARASAPKGSAGTMKVMDFTQSAGTTVITPDQLSVNGAYAMAANPYLVNGANGLFDFGSGASSNLTIQVPVNSNTVYVLVFKVDLEFLPNLQMVVSTGSEMNPGAVQNVETFNGSGGKNEFAYAFTANSTGEIPVTIYSPNSHWSFWSCEISSTAF